MAVQLCPVELVPLKPEGTPVVLPGDEPRYSGLNEKSRPASPADKTSLDDFVTVEQGLLEIELPGLAARTAKMAERRAFHATTPDVEVNT